MSLRGVTKERRGNLGEQSDRDSLVLLRSLRLTGPRDDCTVSPILNFPSSDPNRPIAHAPRRPVTVSAKIRPRQ
jgi:hypothetical protein